MDDKLNLLVELDEAINNFEYLEEEPLLESLTIKISKYDIDKLLQLPLSQLYNYINKEDIKVDMRKKNKKFSDYKISGKDGALSINKMKTYVYINGDADAKDLMKDKITSLESKIMKSHKSDKESYDFPLGSISSIYSLYKRIEKSVLKEDVSISENSNERLRLSDAKFRLSHNPEYIVITDMIDSLSLKRNLSIEDKKELGNAAYEKIKDHEDLKDLADKIDDELNNFPINRKKTISLLSKFVALYKKYRIRQETITDKKIEDMETKYYNNLHEGLE